MSLKHEHTGYHGQRFFPQHCQVPTLTSLEHLSELHNELLETIQNFKQTKQTSASYEKITADIQDTTKHQQQGVNPQEQRVDDSIDWEEVQRVAMSN